MSAKLTAKQVEVLRELAKPDAMATYSTGAAHWFLNGKKADTQVRFLCANKYAARTGFLNKLRAVITPEGRAYLSTLDADGTK